MCLSVLGLIYLQLSYILSENLLLVSFRTNLILSIKSPMPDGEKI